MYLFFNYKIYGFSSFLVKMRLTGSRAYTRPTPVPKMPVGLVELMEGLTKDVLKQNPTDIYEYCANHMQMLLNIRDGPTSKPILEQKIKRAQEKIRRRAEERWQKYLKEMQESAANSDLLSHNCLELNEPENTINIKPPSSQTHSETENTINLKPPIHPELNLKNLSEVEIFHEFSGNLNNLNQLEPILSTDIETKYVNNDTGNVTNKLNIDSLNEITDIISNEKSNIQTNIEEELLKDDVNAINSLEIHTSAQNTKNDIKNDKRNEEQMSDIKDNVAEVKLLSPLNNNHESNNEDKTNINIQTHQNADVSKNGEMEIDNQNNELSIMQGNETKETNQLSEYVLNETDKPNSIITEQNNNCGHYLKEINDSIDLTKNLSHQESKKIIDEQIKLTEFTDNDKISYSESKEHVVRLSDAGTPVNKETTDDTKFETQILTSDNNSFHKIPHEFNEDSVIENENVKLQDINKEVMENVEQDENKYDMLNNDKSIDQIDQKTLIVEKHHKIKDDIEYDAKVENLLKIEDDANSETKVEITENVIVENIHKGEQIEKNYETDDNGIKSDINNRYEQPDVKIDMKVTDSRPFIEKNIEKVEETNNSLILENYNETIAELKSSNENEINNKDTNVSTLQMAIENHSLSQENKRDESATAENDELIQNDTVISIVDPELSNNADVKVEIKSISFDGSTDGNDSSADVKSAISENCEDLNETNISNPSNMDLETAAITIQKVFRSFLFKSRASTLDDTNDEINSLEEDNNKKEEIDYQIMNGNKERRGISRMDTVLQTVNEEKSLSLSTDDSSLSSAATTIQAHVRGFLVRNKLHLNKTSTNSLGNSDGTSTISLDGDIENNKNKTILNIHIVPEGGNYLSRDESVLTSMDISLDGSPPSSLNLHPLGYDRNERKQLKREDAIQSISPPSNNSGKLSEDIDSVKEMIINDGELSLTQNNVGKNLTYCEEHQIDPQFSDIPSDNTTIESLVETEKTHDKNNINNPHSKVQTDVEKRKGTLTKMSSDEMDVVTPFQENPHDSKSADSNSASKLMHSSEFHDIVLPTKVSRSDTSVVRGE
ncbi:putative leucine-rich repeat-containing protein DDB_G0290503 isoform X2 [Galleria mellonella]|uniref:Leucine-rich repeat-containing protein DDB_G0290503 isoform X2 n=1 Tax=Galleria mellonella TaxID=7137 RepID=A0ABM3MYL9_GALME|nr:putative leucine-rich repeat-containing protein DDB_G0290503 isoform X2 [Galleria mellonella]